LSHLCMGEQGLVAVGYARG